MAQTFTRVDAGDLITETTFNQILEALEKLDVRVEALEASAPDPGSLAITDLIPATGPYRVGDVLTVRGRNFEYSIGNARVFLNAVRVQNLDDTASGDTQLVFTIPPVPGVTDPNTSVAVTLRVNNQSQQVSRQILLRAAQPTLFGDVDVEWLSVEPTTIEAGQPATFQFRLKSRASMAATFAIAPQITVAVNQALWQSRLQVLDAALGPLSPAQIQLAQGASALFHVRITEVPTGTGGTSFELSVGATAGNVTGGSGALTFEVGEAVEPPDNTIALNPTTSVPLSALVGDTVTASVGQLVRVRFAAEFQVPGTYSVTLDTPGATSGWTVARFLTTPASYTIDPEDIDSTSGVATRIPEITIQPSAGASSTGQAELRLQRQGASSSKARVLNLSLST